MLVPFFDFSCFFFLLRYCSTHTSESTQMFWSWTMWINETSASYNTQLQHNYFSIFFFFSTLWWVDVIYTYNYSEFPSNTVPLAALYLQWSLEGFIFIFFFLMMKIVSHSGAQLQAQPHQCQFCGVMMKCRPIEAR